MPKSNRGYPYWSEKYSTQRKWRERKRQEFKDVRTALEMFTLGCAYLPNYKKVKTLLQLSQEIEQDLSVKHFGR